MCEQLSRWMAGRASWDNGGLTKLFVHVLAVHPSNPDPVYAGTDGGAYIYYESLARR